MRYFVPFLIIALSIFGCGKNPKTTDQKVVDKYIEPEAPVQEKANLVLKKEPPIEIYRPKSIDSLKIKKINSYRDSLLKIKDTFYLIEKDHQDFECWMTDSIYYTVNKDIILNISRFGCLDEESLVHEVYSDNKLVYFSETKFGDLIKLKKNVIYFDELKPLLVTNYDYDVDWTKRVVKDSTVKFLNLETIKTSQYLKDTFTGTVFSEIDSLTNYMSKSSDSLIIYTDTISYEPSTITYTMDSNSYNTLIK